MSPTRYAFFFFFNDPPTTEIYTLSLHDALPISDHKGDSTFASPRWTVVYQAADSRTSPQHALAALSELCQIYWRSEEHTSELQSRENLVCRLLLEKKNKYKLYYSYHK